ncbi:MAG: radical SAM protein [Candidatus Hecatellales archaeon]|nr:MAG: radical SAM protein [Candidatus Hecatellales archaeon]
MALPEWIVWILTGRCNLSCGHCYASRFRGELEKGEVVRLVGEAAELGVEYINFTGGEPLLYPGFEEVLKETRDRGIEVGVFTNLTLLTPSWVKLFSRLEVSVLSSLDGSRETHEANRGPGSWSKLMKSLSLLKAEGVDCLLTMAISNHNYREAGSFVRLACSLGASAAVIPTMPSGRALENRSYVDSPSFLKALHLVDEASKELGYPVSIWCAPFAGLVVSSPWVDWVSCRLSPSMDLAPNGDILLCDVLDLVLSNVRVKGMRDAWLEAASHPLSREISEPKLGEPCLSCRLKPTCMGGCYARAYLAEGSLSRPDPLCPMVSRVKNVGGFEA